MSNLKLIKKGDDNDHFLTEVLIPVDDPKSKIPQLKEMVRVMREHEGIGLTASQVGLLDRMFVMVLNADKSVKKQPYTIFVINPKIRMIVNKQKNLNKEGCLSYPGVEVEVARPLEIMVEFHDGKKNRRMKLSGLDCRVFLHEYDHCEGECIVSKVKELAKHKKPIDITTLNQ